MGTGCAGAAGPPGWLPRALVRAGCLATCMPDALLPSVVLKCIGADAADAAAAEANLVSTSCAPTDLQGASAGGLQDTTVPWECCQTSLQQLPEVQQHGSTADLRVLLQGGRRWPAPSTRRRAA